MDGVLVSTVLPAQEQDIEHDQQENHDRRRDSPGVGVTDHGQRHRDQTVEESQRGEPRHEHRKSEPVKSTIRIPNRPDRGKPGDGDAQQDNQRNQA